MKACLWIDAPKRPEIAQQCLELRQLTISQRNPEPPHQDFGSRFEFGIRQMELAVRPVGVLARALAHASRCNQLRLGLIFFRATHTSAILLPACKLVAQKRYQFGCADVELVFDIHERSLRFEIVNGFAFPLGLAEAGL